MHKYLKSIRQKASKKNKKIIFPEGEEDRILQAVEKIIKEHIAFPILIGKEKTIFEKIKKLELNIQKKDIKIYKNNISNTIHSSKSNKDSELNQELIEKFYELRKHKGITKDEAKEKLKDMNYFGTMLLHQNYADGLVTGTKNSTADSIRPALEIIKTKEKFHTVSGVFFMILEERLLLFSDAAITIDPTAEQLADITIDTAETAEKFGIKAKIALLSFSTFGSAKHPKVKKIQDTLKIVRQKRPELIIDGEMQVDAALVEKVAQIKCKKSQIQGDANVLIFPNLESANIAYKLVQRLAHAQAIGPILQGLKKPVNDLSRGCSYQDIVNITAFTACECE